MATTFIDSIHNVGIKCSTPDWVNFGMTNDSEGCCGLTQFGIHKFTFQHACKLLKENGKVSFKEIKQFNIFGEDYENKFKDIWNNKDKIYYNLSDIDGISSIGIDGDGNSIYGRRKVL
jgi:hypothetical protein